MLLSDSKHVDSKEVMKTLVHMYNGDVLTDDEEEAMNLYNTWYENSSTGRDFGVDHESGEALRELAEPFMIWLEEGDEADDEEIAVSY